MEKPVFTSTEATFNVKTDDLKTFLGHSSSTAIEYGENGFSDPLKITCMKKFFLLVSKNYTICNLHIRTLLE